MSQQGTELQKFHQRSYIVILTDLHNAIDKMLDKIWSHKHFKALRKTTSNHVPDLFIFRHNSNYELQETMIIKMLHLNKLLTNFLKRSFLKFTS